MVGGIVVDPDVSTSNGNLREPLQQSLGLHNLGGADFLHSHHCRYLPAANDQAECRAAVSRVWLSHCSYVLSCVRMRDSGALISVSQRNDHSWSRDRSNWCPCLFCL